MFCVCVLQSDREGRYCIGSTEDVAKRVVEHNSNRARWTKRYQPWNLVYVEEFATRGEAVRRERELKRLKGIGQHLEALRRGTI